jgi:hypothetical protein
LSPPKPAEANLVAVLCAVGGDTQYRLQVGKPATVVASAKAAAEK